MVGIAGLELQPAEQELFARLPPVGVILFGRNIADPTQLAALVGAIRRAIPDVMLFVDQEGGRVARLRPPHWEAHPPAAALGVLHARDPEAGRRAAWLHGALIGAEAAAAGFDVVCAPVLDLRRPGQSDVVGDRAFSDHPHAVAELGGLVGAGLLAAGVLPVGKHFPGHGQARVDSHAELPEVEAPDAADLLPFRALAHRLPCFMTAHVVYRALSARPATWSPEMLRIARSEMGFDGLMLSDDLAMGALRGGPGRRAANALEAGCDLMLHCSGVLAETEATMAALPPLTLLPHTNRRLAAARALAAARRVALDPASMLTERSQLLA